MNVYLDCESPESTKTSLENIFGISFNELYTEFSLDKPFDDEGWELADKDEFLERMQKKTAGMRFDGTYYFHASRSINPEKYREGLLPLNGMIDYLWDQLYQLVKSDVVMNEWGDFRNGVETGKLGHFSSLYCLKVFKSDSEQGPLGFLLREVPLDQGSLQLNHDYLGVPEIVEDICICYNEKYGVDLLSRFKAVSKPVLVKFRTENINLFHIQTALYYMHLKQYNLQLDPFCDSSIDMKGIGIGKDGIIDIAVL